MRRFLVHPLPKPGKATPLEETEGRHAVEVLRMEAGTIVLAVDGHGGICQAKLQITVSGKAKFRSAELHFHAEVPSSDRPPTDVLPKIILVQSLLKGATMDGVVEQASELGVTRVDPVVSDFSVVKNSHQNLDKPLERWRRIAVQSIKQCERLHAMEVTAPKAWVECIPAVPVSGVYHLVAMERSSGGTLDLLSCLDQNLPQTGEREHSQLSIFVWIGPEGGWSPKERSLFAKSLILPFHLGSNILRSETAAIAAISGLQAWCLHRSSAKE